MLALRSELGYTDRVDRALQDEPEAVSVAYQRLLTDDSHRLAVLQTRATWVSVRDTIRESVESLSGVGFDNVRRDIRALLRQVDRIDKSVAA